MITIYKASQIGDALVPDLNIKATITTPECTDSDYESHYRKFYRSQAATILKSLKQSLPGGTIDHLFALMAEEKASIFRVIP